MTALTKQRPLFIVRQRPRSYTQTPQQKLLSEAAQFCGIRKGMTRRELVHAMRDCLPEFYRQKQRPAQNAGL